MPNRAAFCGPFGDLCGLVACNRDIASGVRSATGPDSRSRRRGNAPTFRGGATTKTAPFRPNPLGRWGLPLISLSLVGHDETASFPPRFAISPGKTHRRHLRCLCYRPLLSSVNALWRRTNSNPDAIRAVTDRTSRRDSGNALVPQGTRILSRRFTIQKSFPDLGWMTIAVATVRSSWNKQIWPRTPFQFL